MDRQMIVFWIISVAMHLPLTSLTVEHPSTTLQASLVLQFRLHKGKEDPARLEKVVEKKPEPPKKRVETRKPLNSREPEEDKFVKPEEHTEEKAREKPQTNAVFSLPETDPVPEGVPTEASHPSVPSGSWSSVPAILPQSGDSSSTSSCSGHDCSSTNSSSPPAPSENLSQNIDALRRDYFTQVIRRIEQKKEYPSIAIRREWEGEVRISFTVKQDGTIEEVRIVKRSDYALLDEAAMAAVKAASPLPPPPPQLEPPLTLRVDLVFKLTD